MSLSLMNSSLLPGFSTLVLGGSEADETCRTAGKSPLARKKLAKAQRCDVARSPINYNRTRLMNNHFWLEHTYIKFLDTLSWLHNEYHLPKFLSEANNSPLAQSQIYRYDTES